MNCNRLEERILDLARAYVNGEVVEQDCAAHVRECPRCSERFASEIALLGAMQEVAKELSTVQAPLHVEQQLRRTFRAQAGLPETPPRKRRIGFGWAKGWALAALAIVLFLVPSVLHRRLFRHSGTAGQIDHAVTEPERPAAILHPSPAPQEGMVAEAVGPERSGRGSTRVNVEDAASEFIPLQVAADPTALEASQVVRIQLPLSEVLEAGLPIDGRFRGTTVEAEVLLGRDGLARAIRFLH